MSTMTNFISELVRAANEIRKVDDYQRSRLIYRAIASIRDGREEIGIPQSKTASNVVIDLQTVAASVNRRSDDEVRAALLNAADIIRTLNIVLNANDEV